MTGDSRGVARSKDQKQNIWWLGTALPFGFFTWASFLYLAVALRKRSWLWVSLFYFSAMVAGLVIGDAQPTLSLLLVVSVWGAGAVHARLVRVPVGRALAARRNRTYGGDVLSPLPDLKPERAGRGATAALVTLGVAAIAFGTLRASDAGFPPALSIVIGLFVLALIPPLRIADDRDRTVAQRIRATAITAALIGTEFALPAPLWIGGLLDWRQVPVTAAVSAFAFYLAYRQLQAASTLAALTTDSDEPPAVLAVAQLPGVNGFREPRKVVVARRGHVEIYTALRTSRPPRPDQNLHGPLRVERVPGPNGVRIGSGDTSLELVVLPPAALRELLVLDDTTGE